MSSPAPSVVGLIQAGDLAGVRAALTAPGGKALASQATPSGGYPIHLAVVSRQLKMVELLLECGADCNCPSEEKGSHLGYTAAHHAASIGDMETLAILSRFHADFNRPSDDKWTPLHVAAFKGRLPVVELLVEHGAAVNCFNSHGQPPILFAVNHGRIRDVRFFIKHRADLAFRDAEGNTLLHHALHFPMSKMFDGQYDVPDAQLDVGVSLVMNGLSPEEVNADGKQATHYVQSRLPALPAALALLYQHCDVLGRTSSELNYLTLVSAKPDHFITFGLDAPAAEALCEAMCAVNAERFAARKGAAQAAAAPSSSSVGPGSGRAAAAETTSPPGHAHVSLDSIKVGDDPSDGQCPFLVKRNRKAAAARVQADDSDKPLCPFSWAFVCHITLLLCGASFVLGMRANQTLRH